MRAGRSVAERRRQLGNCREAEFCRIGRRRTPERARSIGGDLGDGNGVEVQVAQQSLLAANRLERQLRARRDEPAHDIQRGLSRLVSGRGVRSNARRLGRLRIGERRDRRALARVGEKPRRSVEIIRAHEAVLEQRCGTKIRAAREGGSDRAQHSGPGAADVGGDHGRARAIAGDGAQNLPGSDLDPECDVRGDGECIGESHRLGYLTTQKHAQVVAVAKRATGDRGHDASRQWGERLTREVRGERWLRGGDER